MALIKFGLVVVDARGKLGGHVFTKSRKGATIRTKVTPSNPNTTAQSQARQRLANLSTNWGALTDEQRKSWNAATGQFLKTNIFGDNKEPSGRDLYVKLNFNLMTAVASPLVNPPTPQEFPLIDLGETKFDAGVGESVDFADLPTAGDVNFVYVFWATPPMSPGRFNFSGAYRIIAVSQAYNNKAVYTAYIDKYGTPPVGQAIGFGVSQISNVSGQQSPMLTTRAIVEATT